MSFAFRIAAGLVAAVFAAAAPGDESGHPPVSYVISGGISPIAHPVVRVMPDGRVRLAAEPLLRASNPRRMNDS